MTTIERTTNVYVAFDGKEFFNKDKCAEYESTMAKTRTVNLRQFNIEFPMPNNFYSYRAYRINSENEFEMLKVYLLDQYWDLEDYDIEYDGNGWYLVQGSDYGFANIYKLSDVIKDWNRVMDTIASKMVDFD